jgi:hypothetical protein
VSNYSDGRFDTKYGVIHVHNPGSFHEPENLQTYAWDGERQVALQGPALRAFKAAELRITPRRLKRKGKVRHILITGVGYRPYTLQKALYYSPENVNGTRFANPDGSLHCEALAVDIDTRQSARRQRQIRKALEAEGWHYAIPGEPWHASYKLRG